jgi:Flp pilus assembly protein TadB
MALSGHSFLIGVALGLVVFAPTIWQAADDLSAESSQCMSSEATDRVRVLMLEAVDQAFKDHVMHLFDIWLKDSHAEPVRAQKGIRLGVSAYARSRESALRWQPPCML